MNRAVFPGSFDPVTIGHESIIKRASALFDEIVVAIGHNSSKDYFFSLEQRKAWLTATFEGYDNIKVDQYEGLTIEYCKSIDAGYMLRGLRTSADFEFERSIAQMNKQMHANIETVFLLSEPELSAVNSTIVRDIIRHGGDASAFVPKAVKF